MHKDLRIFVEGLAKYTIAKAGERSATKKIKKGETPKPSTRAKRVVRKITGIVPGVKGVRKAYSTGELRAYQKALGIKPEESDLRKKINAWTGKVETDKTIKKQDAAIKRLEKKGIFSHK